MEKRVCCLCGKEFEGFGNNPEPLMGDKEKNKCCNECNEKKVIPARIENFNNGKPARELIEK